jgi:hypothetical protein
MLNKQKPKHSDFTELTYIYRSQNYQVFGLCPSSSVLKNLRTQRFGNWICFRPQVGGKTPSQLGTLERANLNHWTTQVRPEVKYCLIVGVFLKSGPASDEGVCHLS